MENVEELSRALEYPWDKWSIFLHPTQRELSQRDYAGPARIAGSAGTGKTIVALHRAVYLARTHPQARVLLTTFSEALANALRTKLRRLISNEPQLGERIDVHSIDAIGSRLYQSRFGKPNLASHNNIAEVIEQAAAGTPNHKFRQGFSLRNGIKSLMHGNRQCRWCATESPRGKQNSEEAAGDFVVHFQGSRETSGACCSRCAFHEARSRYRERNRSFDFAVIDEAQDLTVAHLRFLAGGETGRTASSPVIWVSGFSNNRSLGSNSGRHPGRSKPDC
jgi:hypothetical protein